MDFVFLDLETSSLDFKEGAVLEVAIRFDYGSAPDGEDLVDDGHGLVWQTKVKPWSMEGAQAEALEVNGYKEEDWVGAPPFAEVAPTILRLLKGRVIVGHNPSFDYYFLKHELERCGLPTSGLNRRMVDTTTLIYENLFFPGLVTSVSLDSTRKFYGLPAARPHAAGRDTRDVRLIFYRLAKNVTCPVKRYAYVIPTFKFCHFADEEETTYAVVNLKLLLPRSESDHEGAIGLFGGSMEPEDGGDAREAMIRELEEENQVLRGQADGLRHLGARIQADPGTEPYMVDFFTVDLGRITGREFSKIAGTTREGAAFAYTRESLREVEHQLQKPMFGEMILAAIEGAR